MKKTIVWLMNMVDIMGINYERETLISGYYFEPFDSDSFLIDVCDPGAKLIYMDEGFDKESFYRIRKMLQMLATSYRLVMISKNGVDSIGYIVFQEDDAESLSEVLDWVCSKYNEWKYGDLENIDENICFVGYRIPNNPFHEKKLLLQGEIL